MGLVDGNERRRDKEKRRIELVKGKGRVTVRRELVEMGTLKR